MKGVSSTSDPVAVKLKVRRSHGRPADRARAGDDGGGIDAAGQRNAGRHVAAQMKLDGPDQRLAHLARRGLGTAVLHRDGRPPERHRRDGRRIERNAREASRRQAADIGEHRPLAFVGLADRQEQAGAGLVDAAPDAGHVEQRTDLGGDGEMAAAARPEQRLDAEGIARQEQFPAFAVEHDEGVHAGEPLQRLLAPARIGRDEHLAVGRGAEDVAVAREGLAQLDVIVDLAVEDEHVAAVRRRHRLVGARIEIDDREPAVQQCEFGRVGGSKAAVAPIGREPAGIRSPMRQVRHRSARTAPAERRCRQAQ